MELRLKDILKEREMTLSSFAKVTGISPSNLSNYINGNISPTLETLEKIAKALNIEVTELLRPKEDIELFAKYKGRLYSITQKDIIYLLKSKLA